MGQGCNIPGCQCTHDGGCDRGWIDLVDERGDSLDKTSPCPTCRPGLKRVIDSSWDWEDRAAKMERLRGLEAAEFADYKRQRTTARRTAATAATLEHTG